MKFKKNIKQETVDEKEILSKQKKQEKKDVDKNTESNVKVETGWNNWEIKDVMKEKVCG